MCVGIHCVEGVFSAPWKGRWGAQSFFFHVLHAYSIVTSFPRHLLGCLEEAHHQFDEWSKLLVHLSIPFNIKASNWAWARYYTKKNWCYTLPQPKGTAVKAGCWACIGGTHLVQLFLWCLVIQQWPGGWGRNYNEHLLFQGAGWPALANAKVRERAGEQRERVSALLLRFFPTRFRDMCLFKILI